MYEVAIKVGDMVYFRTIEETSFTHLATTVQEIALEMGGRVILVREM